MLLVGPADAPYNAQTLRQIAIKATGIAAKTMLFSELFVIGF
jgi:hypothetical protein